jgi:proteic killer suppression protein
MISSFENEITEQVFHGITSSKVRHQLPQHIIKIAERKLDMLNTVHTMGELKLIPSNEGQPKAHRPHDKYWIPLDQNWHIAFRWNNDGAEAVEIRSA